MTWPTVLLLPGTGTSELELDRLRLRAYLDYADMPDLSLLGTSHPDRLLAKLAPLLEGTGTAPVVLDRLPEERLARRILVRALLTLGTLRLAFTEQDGILAGTWYGDARLTPMTRWADRRTLELLAQAQPVADTHAAGCWRPGQSILLLGDRPNAHSDRPLWQRLPFAGLSNSGCSRWLAQQLETANLPERLFVWANCYTVSGFPISGQWLADLQPALIVCLGNEAQRWLQSMRPTCTDYVWVPHPSHWRRFHANEQYPLITAIQQHLIGAEETCHAD